MDLFSLRIADGITFRLDYILTEALFHVNGGTDEYLIFL